MEAGGGHGRRKQETQEDDWVRTLVTLSASVSPARTVWSKKLPVIFETVEQVSEKKSLKGFFSSSHLNNLDKKGKRPNTLIRLNYFFTELLHQPINIDVSKFCLNKKLF